MEMAEAVALIAGEEAGVAIAVVPSQLAAPLADALRHGTAIAAAVDVFEDAFAVGFAGGESALVDVAIRPLVSASAGDDVRLESAAVEVAGR